jgi:hypothetical protein
MPVQKLNQQQVIPQGGGGNEYILQPGVYVGGLSFTGQDSVVLTPGIYYMQGGGFSFSGQGSLTATNVMLFNGLGNNGKAGNISITGLGAVNWTPPATGQYRGISFFQARGITQTVKISGNGGMNITGAWYARDALCDVGGNGVNIIGTQFVCWQMVLHGTGTYIVPWDPGNLMPVRDLKLVE